MSFLKTQASLCLLLFTQLAHANPTGGDVVSGSASIDVNGTTTTIIQTTDTAIINWQDFSIDENELTQFIQPNSGSISLNRVISKSPSKLLGQLKANGHVFLINPNGILFGINARVDVGGLVATTTDITNENFLSGNYQFDIPGVSDAEVINYGHISTVADQGLVALVAPSVVNEGVITATMGKVVLGAGTHYTLDLYGDDLITFAVPGGVPETLFRVDNKGNIKADGGVVFLTAQAADDLLESVINVSGVIEARSVEEKFGRIVLMGSNNSLVQVTGTLDVSGTLNNEAAGLIQITGHTVQIGDVYGAPTYLIADGNAGGGVINIGGALQGKGSLPNAMKTMVYDGAVITADALKNGDGGQVVVWSDNETTFSGYITARGGSEGGNGGFVETSGKDLLHVLGGMVVTLAPLGDAGTWLLDPTTYTIDASTEATILAGLTNNATFQILADEDITVAADYAFSWSNASTLSIEAGNDIIFGANSSIANTSSGSLALRADSDANSSGTVTFNSGASVNYAGSTGNVNLFYNPSSYASPTDYSSNVTMNTGTFTPYMLVNNLTQLQLMSTNLSGKYALGTNINAVGSYAMNGGLGFDPIGDATNKFTGTFNGNGKTISNLYINRPTEDYVGLFGYADGATFSGINYSSFVVTGSVYTGSFAGFINNSTLGSTVGSASVTGLDYVGGIYGRIDESNVTGLTQGVTNVTGDDFVGGIAGASVNNVIVGNIFHVGNVTGDEFVGGLVGFLDREVLISGLVFNNGDVTGNSSVGGIAGIVSGVSFLSSQTVGLGGLSGNISGGSSSGGILGRLQTSDLAEAFAGYFSNASVLSGLNLVDRLVGSGTLSNVTINTGVISDLIAEGFNTGIYRQLLGQEGLFTYKTAETRLAEKVKYAPVDANGIFTEMIAKDFFSAFFNVKLDEYGRAQLDTENVSHFAKIAAALSNSNKSLSSSGVMAMGAGVGGLVLAKGGMLQGAFSQSMGANVFALFGLVSMGQATTGVDAQLADAGPFSMTKLGALFGGDESTLNKAKDSGLCGVTCQVVLLSMQSPGELPGFAEGGIAVNPALYVKSGVRPDSEVEQRYTWSDKEDRYVRTESLHQQSAVNITPDGIMIMQPL